MPECLKKIYIGASARKKAETIERVIERGSMLPELYLITFASNGADQLDILHSRYLLREKIRENLPPVAGYAFGMDEALEVVQCIAEDTYAATGACDMKAYLLSIQNE